MTIGVGDWHHTVLCRQREHTTAQSTLGWHLVHYYSITIQYIIVHVSNSMKIMVTAAPGNKLQWVELDNTRRGWMTVILVGSFLCSISQVFCANSSVDWESYLLTSLYHTKHRKGGNIYFPNVKNSFDLLSVMVDWFVQIK